VGSVRQASIQENLSKQTQLMEVISSNQAAYKQVFGFREWRAACEVRLPLPPSSLYPLTHPPFTLLRSPPPCSLNSPQIPSPIPSPIRLNPSLDPLPHSP
jgi:hypothetical protein